MALGKPFLDVQNLTKSFGADLLFQDISFSVSEGEHVGLIARNGTGKSTLLSILSGKEGKDGGEIRFRNGINMGYLEQKPVFNPEESVLDACFNHKGDAGKVLKATQILTQLDIVDLRQPMKELSGGQQKRVALANVLLQEPDLLLLDEPTNHLDLATVEWLENYLSRGTKTLLMVTHDRYFLDRICNVILELDDNTVYTYRGNYSYYLEKRQQRLDNARTEIAKANSLYRKELEWMRRMPQARGHKAKYREDAFHELEKQAKKRIDDRQINFQSDSLYIGTKIFEAQYVSKQYGDKIILNDFHYNFSRYEKMGITGKNGTGKSTFVKLLLGLESPDKGKFDIGKTIRFGYFSQDDMQFDGNDKVIDAVTKIAERVTMGNGKQVPASQFLQYFLFTPEQQHNFIGKLSGGEQRKLYLCTVLMKNPNFLVLDEPTNNLDIPTLQVFENYLEDFPGCVIIVSHDRYFMDKVVDHILIFEGGGIVKDFPGNYTQYRNWSEMKTRKERESEPRENSKKREQRQRRPSQKMTFKEKREFEQLGKEIKELEEQEKAIEDELNSGKLPVEELTEKSVLLPRIKDEIDGKSMRWLELSEKT